MPANTPDSLIIVINPQLTVTQCVGIIKLLWSFHVSATSDAEEQHKLLVTERQLWGQLATFPRARPTGVTSGQCFNPFLPANSAAHPPRSSEDTCKFFRYQQGGISLSAFTGVCETQTTEFVLWGDLSRLYKLPRLLGSTKLLRAPTGLFRKEATPGFQAAFLSCNSEMSSVRINTCKLIHNHVQHQNQRRNEGPFTSGLA